MNERILKLFTKACYHGDYEPENVPTEVIEKFAELLIRECAEAALAKGRASPDTDFRTGSILLSEYLLVRFGVEE